MQSFLFGLVQTRYRRKRDRLLMTLMYWREYRIYEHIGETYGVSESTVCCTVKSVENVLIKDKRFHLPGKKVLCQSATVFEVTMVDHLPKTPSGKTENNNINPPQK